MNLHFLAIALAASIASPLATAGVYKWTDAQGNTHYGDSPRPAVTATALKIDNGPTGASLTNAGIRAGERQMLDRAEERDRKTALDRQSAQMRHAAEQRAEQRTAALYAERCASYRARLERVEADFADGYTRTEERHLQHDRARYSAKATRYCKQ